MAASASPLSKSQVDGLKRVLLARSPSTFAAAYGDLPRAADARCAPTFNAPPFKWTRPPALDTDRIETMPTHHGDVEKRGLRVGVPVLCVASLLSIMCGNHGGSDPPPIMMVPTQRCPELDRPAQPRKYVHTNASTTACTTTFVTAYFDIQSKHSRPEYAEWIGNLVAMRLCMVVFTDSPGLWAQAVSRAAKS